MIYTFVNEPLGTTIRILRDGILDCTDFGSVLLQLTAFLLGSPVVETNSGFNGMFDGNVESELGWKVDNVDTSGRKVERVVGGVDTSGPNVDKF